MSDFAQLLLPFDVSGPVLSSLGPGSPMGDTIVELGATMTGIGAVTATANMASFFPVLVQKRCTVSSFAWWNGATMSGNLDAGIYDKLGNLLAHTGSTAQSGASAIQTAAALVSATLNPDLYYLALVADNTTGQIARVTANGPVLRACGCAQMATAFPLPNPATFAAMAQIVAPLVVAQAAGVF